MEELKEELNMLMRVITEEEVSETPLRLRPRKTAMATIELHATEENV